MSRRHDDPIPAPWRGLGETLAGHLTARALGLLASDFALLDREGTKVGHLEVDGTAGAAIRVGGIEAWIEHAGPSRYRMLSCGAELLTSNGNPNSPRITCLDQPYWATVLLLRNRAEAGPAGEGATVRIAGGLTNKRYEVTFGAENQGSLPVALFLFYRTVTLRRTAYST